MECTLYLSEGCNFKCTYCYEGIEKRNEQMNVNTLEQAMTYIVSNSIKNEDIYITFLGGEPLLNKPLFLYAINLINTKYKNIRDQFKLKMTTNGVFLDDEIIKIIKRERIDLSISIDGREETQKINRLSANGENTYDLIMTNIKKLKDNEVNFNVRMTVCCNNVEKMYENVCYFLKLNINRIYLSYNYFDDWKEEKLQILHYQMNLLDELYIKDISLSRDKMVNLYDFKYTTFFCKRPIEFCSAGSVSHFVVDACGDIFPCGYVTNNKEWKIGNIWEGIQKEKFVCEARKHIVKEYNKCRVCKYAFTCISTRCGFLNYKVTGYLNKSDCKICKLEKILYNHNLKVLKALHKRKCPRLMRYIDTIIKYQIEPNDCIQYMIEGEHVYDYFGN